MNFNRVTLQHNNEIAQGFISVTLCCYSYVFESLLDVRIQPVEAMSSTGYGPSEDSRWKRLTFNGDENY